MFAAIGFLAKLKRCIARLLGQRDKPHQRIVVQRHRDDGESQQDEAPYVFSF